MSYGYIPKGTDEWQEMVGTSLVELRLRFQPWQQKVKKWQAMIEPPEKQAKSTAAMMRSKDVDLQSTATRYVSNFVETGCTTLIGRLDRADPKPEIAILAQTQANIMSESRVERLLKGVLRQANSQTIAERTGVSFQRQVYASLGRTGKVVGRIQIIEGKRRDKFAHVEWKLYEPFNSYCDFGPLPRRFVYEEALTPRQAELLLHHYNIEDVAKGALKATWQDKKHLVFAEHWYETEAENGEPEVYYTVTLDGKLVHHKLTLFERCPVKMVNVNNLNGLVDFVTDGITGDGPSASVMERHAIPWFAPVEHTIPQFEAMKALEMLATSLAVLPPKVVTNPDGSQETITAEQERYMLVPGATAYLPPGTKVDLLQATTQFISQNSVIQSLERDMENVLPSILRGRTPPSGTSGYLWRQEEDTAEIAFGHYARGAANFFNECFEEFLFQARQEHNKGLEMKVTGRVDTDRRPGKLQVEIIKLNEIPEDLVVDTQLAPMMPKDEITAMTLATQLVAAGLMSRIRAMSGLVNIEDPYSELTRIAEDEFRSSPMVKQTEYLSTWLDKINGYEVAAQQAAVNGNTEEAALHKAKAAMLYRWLIDWERKLMFQGAPGQGTPPAPPGTAPQVSPPEQVGNRQGFNPDQHAAALGKAPYRGGRPPVAQPGGNGQGGMP